MAETTRFELVSPERLFFSEQVEMVVVPGSEGDFGALPLHAPMLSTVRPGVIVIYEGGKPKERIFVAGGFAEVTEESCTVMAEEAVIVSDLTEDMALSRQMDAQALRSTAKSVEEMEAAELAIVIAAEMMAAAKGEFAYR